MFASKTFNTVVMKIKSTYKALAAIILVIITMEACQKMFPPAPTPSDDLTQGVVPGLTPAQLQEHALGDAEFSQIFTQQEGLGPVFNQNSCNNCHVGNGKGSPATALTRFGRMVDSVFDSLVAEGGPDLLPNAVPGYQGEVLPPDANVQVHLIAPTIMGLGFIAAMSDSSILANAYPHDGVSGVPNYVNPTPFFVPLPINIPHNGQYIGRFGKKATRVAVEDQVVFALLEDLGGVTCDFDQNKPYNYLVGPYTGNYVQDPNVGVGFVTHLVMYLRTNKVPPRRDTNDPNVQAGEKLFTQIGCVSCHVPTQVTAFCPDIQALSNKVFHPYSDFLLHDMGPELDDGVPEGSAKSFQWRTAPLWGVGLAGNAQGGGLFLLHDGRATSFVQAISFHNGEASARKSAFFALTQQQQQQIVAFLNSL
ncbi:MAG: di-heme oxidoredictase family protein [Bacteroidia bacterium]